MVLILVDLARLFLKALDHLHDRLLLIYAALLVGGRKLSRTSLLEKTYGGTYTHQSWSH